jgi:hypothetical protein
VDRDPSVEGDAERSTGLQDELDSGVGRLADGYGGEGQRNEKTKGGNANSPTDPRSHGSVHRQALGYAALRKMKRA